MAGLRWQCSRERSRAGYFGGRSIRLFRKAYKGAAECNFGLEVTEGSLTALKVALNLAPEASLLDG